MTNRMAIDVGSGVTKLAWYSDPEKSQVDVMNFPTVAGAYENGPPADEFGIESVALIHLGEAAWAIGKDAQRLFRPEQRVSTLSTDWAGSEGWLAVLYAAIAIAFPEGGEFDLDLATGLPQAMFSRQRQDMLTLLDKQHEFVSGDRHYRIRINPTMIPQALSALLYEAIHDTSVMNLRSGVIDIGTYTSGFATLHDGRLQPWQSGGIEVGVSVLTESLARWLLDEKGLRVDQAEMPDVMLNRSVLVRGDKIELDEVIDQLATKVAEPIEEALIEKWEHGANDIARVFVSGGGSALFTRAIQRIAPHAQPSKDPRYAVVRGLLLYMDD
ncbi:MAG: ParM/StbA family protein [gamma proteobacterium symbiont of Bathyaustriella thionipta]|nr:ParM/StbA family protein [gamma proteobacterium symbiont of Bathyaustriella thionipta]